MPSIRMYLNELLKCTIQQRSAESHRSTISLYMLHNVMHIRYAIRQLHSPSMVVI